MAAKPDTTPSTTTVRRRELLGLIAAHGAACAGGHRNSNWGGRQDSVNQTTRDGAAAAVVCGGKTKPFRKTTKKKEWDGMRVGIPIPNKMIFQKMKQWINSWILASIISHPSSKNLLFSLFFRGSSRGSLFTDLPLLHRGWSHERTPGCCGGALSYVQAGAACTAHVHAVRPPLEGDGSDDAQ